MPSSRIIWSPMAKTTYYSILEYLDENWTSKEVNAFINKTEEVITHISKYPQHYPYSKENDAYKCVFIKQVSLFYRVKESQIQLLVFWDNRQDPSKLIL